MASVFQKGEGPNGGTAIPVLEFVVRINTVLTNCVFIMKKRTWEELHTRVLLKVCHGEDESI